MHLFGRKKDPKVQLKEMTSVLRRQKYTLQRDIQTHLRQQKQLEMAIKKCARESDIPSAKVYAKEYAESKKTIGRLYLAMSQIDSVAMELRHMASVSQLTSGMEKSTTVMSAMSALVKMPELQSTMQNLSKEMMKAGIIEEMISDTFEPLASVENEDDLASAEVNRVLWDLTAGQLGKAPEPANDSLSVSKAQTELSVLSVQDDDEAEVNARLAALRS
ncbi:unnamed protein product [Schistosoma turkestanicum]|nr:unnamed protein product [Schistosoma turkestanicum]